MPWSQRIAELQRQLPRKARSLQRPSSAKTIGLIAGALLVFVEPSWLVLAQQPDAVQSEERTQDKTKVTELGEPALVEEGTEPPPGYETRAAVMTAIASGQLELIRPSETLPVGVREIEGVEFHKVQGRSLQLDLALPVNPSTSIPGLIFIHGGGWSDGKRNVYHYYTRQFAAAGYAAATISYRLSGEASFPAASQDVFAAIRWMREHAAEYNIDADRIALVGGSAGAHLALLAAYASDERRLTGPQAGKPDALRVAAVVDFYGPVDLTTEQARSSRAVSKFMGGPYEEIPSDYALASPIKHVDRRDPPTLIFHGTIDQIVSIRQSDALAKRLAEKQCPAPLSAAERLDSRLGRRQGNERLLR